MGGARPCNDSSVTRSVWADWPVLGRSMLRLPWVIRDVEVFPCLEVDAPSLLELSVGSKGTVGPTDSVN